MKKKTKADGLAKSEGPPDTAAGPARVSAGVVTLNLHVQPGARTTGWAGRRGDALRLRIAARAVDGLANRACVEFLAEALGIAKSAIVIVHGERARTKLVRVAGASAAQVQSLLEACGP
jgi:uncharacterized protein